MIKHYFKLVWSRRKSHIFIMLTLMLSFFALSFFMSVWINELSPIVEDRGFNHEHVFQFELTPNDSLSIAEKNAAYHQVKLNVEALPEVQSSSFTFDAVPFVERNNWRPFLYKDEEWWTPSYWVDEDYAKVMGISMIMGDWIGKQNGPTPHPPVVVNRVMAQRFLGEDEVIGKTFNDKRNGQEYTVVGVVETYNHFRDDSWETPAIFLLSSDAAPEREIYPNQLLVKFNEEANVPDLREKLEKTIEGTAISGGWKMGQRATLSASLNLKMNSLKAGATAIGFVFFILIGNIAVGILGSIWHQVILRTGEIGIRRSMGSTKIGIRRMVVGEAIALASVAIGIGSLFFLQMPLFNFNGLDFPTSLSGMTVSAIFVYGVVFACAWYPSWQAGSIQPAVALHEE